MPMPLKMLVQDAGAGRKGESIEDTVRTFEQVWSEAKQLDTGLREDEERDRFLGVWALNREMYERHPDFAENVRFMARIGGGGAVRTSPPAREHEPPARLDAAGRTLYAEVQRQTVSKGVPFLVALAKMTGQPVFPGADVPPPTIEQTFPGMDPSQFAEDSVELDRRARALAVSEDIGYIDSSEIAELEPKIAAAKAETGASEVEWLDTSRPLRPAPWNADHWERDQRRADAAGVPVLEEEWRQAAEEGQDLVYARAEEGRQGTLRALEDRRSQWLETARRAETDRRVAAIEAELSRQASERLKGRR